MSDTATRQDIDEVLGVIQDLMKQVGEKFGEVNKRFDEQDRKYDHLINTIDGFIARIDKYETELAARDSRLEKLLAWARKVSVKTGIPLENL